VESVVAADMAIVPSSWAMSRPYERIAARSCQALW
jgi:hypothetical protein